MAATSRTLIPVKGSDEPFVDAFVVELDESHKLDEPEAVEHSPPYADVAGEARAAGASASMNAHTSAARVVLAAFMRDPQVPG